ncbi:hypothetical protein GDO86_009156 [Hymenochirus boettgeri]|uniref:Xanthine dehydrogenase n=1 Tax=Hymenochirus boettgeri TaxID=247094 RepID=A0A8T2JK34_9PIPI|nr:hypothetical protein GDO86_009156 [Hymenochirus boettgeri]
MSQAQKQTLKTANSSRRDTSIFKVGDFVWLSTRNIRLKIPSTKLGPRFLGPFLIKKAINTVAFKLDLPKSLKIHPVFHVSCFKRYVSNSSMIPPPPPPPPVLVDGAAEYVETILDSKISAGKLRYLIIEKNADPKMTLLTYLRRKLGLPGTKLGCGEGGCGACTVMVSRFNQLQNKIVHYSVNACLAPICSLHHTAVTTVEGIGSTKTRLHPVQERIAKSHGSQCGFCTPGIVMSMYTLLRNTPQPTMDDIENTFQGNLCRCTGYRPILEGFKTFTKEGCCGKRTENGCCMNMNGTDEIHKDLSPRSLCFKGDNVTWFQPSNLKELLALKSQYPDAKLVVGNTEVGIAFGAACSLSTLEKVLRKAVGDLPLYRTEVFRGALEQLRWFAGQQIRNVAAIGGNIMTASPISDLNPVFMASGSKLCLLSQENSSKTTGILLSIEIPYSKKSSWESIQLCYGGMAPITVLAKETSKELAGNMSALAKEMSLSASAPGGMVEFRQTLTLSFFFKFYLMNNFTVRIPPKYESAAELYHKLHPTSVQLYQEIPEGQSGSCNLPGSVCFLFAEDVPGYNVTGLGEDETVFAKDVVTCIGHVIGGVVADTKENAQRSFAAKALGVSANKIVVRVKRMGGGFGGKESRSTIISTSVALAAHKTGYPVRCMLDRDEDMLITGGRHPYLGRYKVGFKKSGKITALDISYYSNAGNSMDLSQAIIDRTLFHMDNSYKIPNIIGRGYVCKTNLPSNTAFRGFGGPQGMLVTEAWINDIAQTCGLPAEQVRQLNLYSEGDLTHFNQKLEGCTVRRCWEECMKQANYQERKISIEEFNRQHRWKKRGIAMIPTKFGISFTLTLLNQGGALVHIYTDGSVLLTHGGTEMGQGLHTKMVQVASKALGVPTSKIFISETSTNTVPNTSPTAASISSDLNGMAIYNACQTLLQRMEPYKKSNPKGSWESWINEAYVDRVSLSATGFYKIPGLGYDTEKNKGNVSHYFSYGVACSEVEIDCLTGDHKNLRTDIVMDVGTSLNPAIDIGQVEGAFVQGLGLFTLEEMKYSPNGFLYTRGPGMYKIPAFGDIPIEFNVSLLRNCPNSKAIYSSKAVGEPPLFLSSSVFYAIKEAITSARAESGISGRFRLDSPATPERIRNACVDDFTKLCAISEPGTPWAIRV